MAARKSDGENNVVSNQHQPKFHPFSSSSPVATKTRQKGIRQPANGRHDRWTHQPNHEFRPERKVIERHSNVSCSQRGNQSKFRLGSIAKSHAGRQLQNFLSVCRDFTLNIVIDKGVPPEASASESSVGNQVNVDIEP